MELKNRNRLEQDFAGELAELTQEQRTRLRQYLGTPPDPSRVPESFWQEIRDDTQRRIAAIAYLLFIAAAEEHASYGGTQATSTSFDIDATAFALQQAQTMANGYTNASRDRFQAFGRRLLEPVVGRPELATPTVLATQQLADEVADIIRVESAERIATTVTTSAQTAGGNAGINAARGDNKSRIAGMVLHKFWTNHPELTRTGPCPRCEALHGEPEERWAEIDSEAGSGPPLHDYCACTTNYIFTPQQD